MSKEERQKELRERLVPEIKFEHTVQAIFVGTFGSLGKYMCRGECTRGFDLNVELCKQTQREVITERIMNQVFEKEGCL